MDKEIVGKVEFFKAFNRCQGALAPAKRDSKNTHFGNTYASLSAVMDAIQPFFESGFSLLQGGVDIGGKPYLRTKLIHSGHEEIFDYPLTVDSNPQHTASATTYARRYSICAIVGLCVEDDDAEIATRSAPGALINNKSENHQKSAVTQSEEILEIEGIPEAVTEKQFGVEPKTWMSYSVKINKEWYSCRDENVWNDAQAAISVGRSLKLYYKINGKYKNIIKSELNVPF